MVAPVFCKLKIKRSQLAIEQIPSRSKPDRAVQLSDARKVTLAARKDTADRGPLGFLPFETSS